MNSIAKVVGPFALVVAWLGPLAAGAADRPRTVAAAIEQAFRPLADDYDVPGLAVAVTVDGQQHFYTYGVTSRGGETEVTADTLFELGSVSKTFTATLATYAQALGKLSLEDRPAKYMTELSGSALDRASLLNLGTYTAGGLPLQFPDAVAEAGMAAYFRDFKPAAAPGERRRYSNPSIGLFGHIAGLAMGGDFTALAETELFPRLGLGDTHIRVPDDQMQRYAWGHNKAGKRVRATPGVLDAEAYGVKSSVADMIRFIEVNIQPDSLDAPLRRAVEDTHVGYFEIGGMVQGLGWEQYPYPVALDRLLAGNARTMAMEPNAATKLAPPRRPEGPTLFNKTGSTNGFGAYVAFVPEARIGLVMLANRNVPIPARITAAHAVLEYLSANAQ